jgi:hypothetical protein
MATRVHKVYFHNKLLTENIFVESF